MPSSRESSSTTRTSYFGFTKGKNTASGDTMSKDALSGAVKIIEGRFYYNAYATDPKTAESGITNYTYISQVTQGRDDDQQSFATKKKVHFFSIDSELVYWNFFLDFGPLNLGQLFRFCQKLNAKLQDPRLANRVIIFYSNATFEKRANAIYLLSAWLLLYMGCSPQQAIEPFESAISNRKQSKYNSPRSVLPTRVHDPLSPVPPFHDASPCECTYDLNILDCLKGLAKARTYNFFNFDHFNVQEYEYFEQVENGDLNWIVKDKFLAFAGPQYKRNVSREGCYTLTPSDYIPYFKSKNVGLVVRLNKKMYDENDFRRNGIEHFEQYYLDGSCPSIPILRKIVKAFEMVPKDKAIAVHCKAGLGRTGTCIGAYIMKHYKFTAREVIGWMRICRPGMVIGPQQHFLEEIQQQMWYEGERMRMSPSKMIVSSSSQYQRNDEDKKKKKHDPTSEAIIGRAGQADELLARRMR